MNGGNALQLLAALGVGAYQGHEQAVDRRRQRQIRDENRRMQQLLFRQGQEDRTRQLGEHEDALALQNADREARLLAPFLGKYENPAPIAEAISGLYRDARGRRALPSGGVFPGAQAPGARVVTEPFDPTSPDVPHVGAIGGGVNFSDVFSRAGKPLWQVENEQKLAAQDLKDRNAWMKLRYQRGDKYATAWLRTRTELGRNFNIPAAQLDDYTDKVMGHAFPGGDPYDQMSAGLDGGAAAPGIDPKLALGALMQAIPPQQALTGPAAGAPALSPGNAPARPAGGGPDLPAGASPMDVNDALAQQTLRGGGALPVPPVEPGPNASLADALSYGARAGIGGGASFPRPGAAGGPAAPVIMSKGERDAEKADLRKRIDQATLAIKEAQLANQPNVARWWAARATSAFYSRDDAKAKRDMSNELAVARLMGQYDAPLGTWNAIRGRLGLPALPGNLKLTPKPVQIPFGAPQRLAAELTRTLGDFPADDQARIAAAITTGRPAVGVQKVVKPTAAKAPGFTERAKTPGTPEFRAAKWDGEASRLQKEVDKLDLAEAAAPKAFTPELRGLRDRYRQRLGQLHRYQTDPALADVDDNIQRFRKLTGREPSAHELNMISQRVRAAGGR